MTNDEAKIVLRAMASLMLLSDMKERVNGENKIAEASALIDKFVKAVDIACFAIDMQNDKLEIKRDQDGEGEK